MKSLEFDQYEKITDTVYFLGQGVVLKFNVQLGTKNSEGGKFSLHNEYKYHSNKYNNVNELITVKRNFDYFLSFETTSVFKDKKEFIMIYPKDMLYLKMSLNEAFSWFTDAKYKGLYKYRDNKLIICGKPETINVKGLAMDKFISFEPTVCHFNNGIDQMGVRITLNSMFIDITVDILAGLLYTLNDFNMYLCAQNMINYLQRPVVYGYNMYEFSNEDCINNVTEDGFIESNTKRQIKSKKSQKSFFSKVDEM